MNTVQRRLLDDPEGDFGSDYVYSDDKATSPLFVIKNAGVMYLKKRKNRKNTVEKACNVVATPLLLAKVICTYG